MPPGDIAGRNATSATSILFTMPFTFRRPPAMAVDETAIERFLATLPPDPDSRVASSWSSSDTRALLGVDDPTFTALVERHAGETFGGGLLRLLPTIGRPNIRDWNGPDGWHSDWPSVRDSVAFASNWRGNLFLFDRARLPTGERKIAFLELATGEYEVIDYPFRWFIGELLPRQEGLLAAADLEHWQAIGGRVPKRDECVGLRIPLVVGGQDEVANFEVLFLNVWVSIAGQIYEQTRNLPPGTRITGFRMDG